MPRHSTTITARRRRFVDAYLKDPNGTHAAIEAGYSEKGARQTGSILLSNPNVLAEIQKRQARLLKRAEVTAERVLAELAAIAFLDPANFYDEAGNLIPVRNMAPEVRRALTSLEVEEICAGRSEHRAVVGALKKIKFANKLGPLNALARYLPQFFKDKPEVSTPNDGPIPVTALRALLTDAFAPDTTQFPPPATRLGEPAAGQANGQIKVVGPEVVDDDELEVISMEDLEKVRGRRD
jgi:phage terminase small subunit